VCVYVKSEWFFFFSRIIVGKEGTQPQFLVFLTRTERLNSNENKLLICPYPILTVINIVISKPEINGGMESIGTVYILEYVAVSEPFILLAYLQAV